MKDQCVLGLRNSEMVAVLLPNDSHRTKDGERTPSPGQHPLATAKVACAPKSSTTLVFVLGDQSKQAVLFVSYSCGEIDAIT
jgi:hypothetical protein